MPTYDEALHDWFHNIISDSSVRRIAILDPNSVNLTYRWQHKLRRDIEVAPFPGLPEGLNDCLRKFVMH